MAEIICYKPIFSGSQVNYSIISNSLGLFFRQQSNTTSDSDLKGTVCENYWHLVVRMGIVMTSNTKHSEFTVVVSGQNYFTLFIFFSNHSCFCGHHMFPSTEKESKTIKTG